MTTGCPDVESLEQYASGDIDASDAARVREHVSTCAACRTRLDDVSENLRLAGEVRRVLRGDGAEPDAALPSNIGGYRIIREIGRGGMGIVYLAEQASPRRHVALKVIRPGAGSATLMRRFEREAAVLARLQHAGIAQIFEAGVAETQSAGGRVEHQPFLAMEFIQGEPLLEFAARRSLKAGERLALLADIADAVHHAHVQGVIHRDLKPGNILVQALEPDSPEPPTAGARTGRPKILDFGVARITEADVQAVTMQTDVGQLVGTIPYMSPEQVSGRTGDLDARSDVYALGVIAYELLSARLPHEVRNCAIPEAVRMIRDDDPTPLSAIDRSFRGDIETLVAKALEKDRTRRYASAAEFAADIRRHLRDEPIVARPASSFYQLGKFARRNKALVGGVAIAFVALIAGFAVATWEARVATRARDAALAQTQVAKAVNAFVEDMLSAADPRNLPNRRDLTVREAIDQAAAELDAGALADQPKTEAGVRATIGNTYRALGMLPEGERQLAESVRIGRTAYEGDDESLAFSLHKLALVYSDLGRFDESESLVREALAMRRRLFGDFHPDVLKSMNNLAQVRFDQGDYEEAETLHRRTLALRRELLGHRHTDVANSLNNLATVVSARRNPAEAEALYRQSLEIDRAYHGEFHPHVAVTMSNLASILREQEKFDQAQALLTKALTLQKQSLGPTHPGVAETLIKLAELSADLGNTDEAEQRLLEAAEIQKRTLGERHPSLARTLTALARIKEDRGNLDAARHLLADALAIQKEALGEDHRETIFSAFRIAMIDVARSDDEGAQPQFARIVDAARRALPAEDIYTGLFLREHGRCLQRLGRLEPAVRSLAASYDIVAAYYGVDHAAARDIAGGLAGLYDQLGQPAGADLWRAKSVDSVADTK